LTAQLFADVALNLTKREGVEARNRFLTGNDVDTRREREEMVTNVLGTNGTVSTVLLRI
jgi:hypothetical protein